MTIKENLTKELQILFDKKVIPCPKSRMNAFIYWDSIKEQVDNRQKLQEMFDFLLISCGYNVILTPKNCPKDSKLTLPENLVFKSDLEEFEDFDPVAFMEELEKEKLSRVR